MAKIEDRAIWIESSGKTLEQALADGEFSGYSPDATASVKGRIKLAGDLGGSADSPTVPALAQKADATAVSAALALKANTNSPALTGVPTAPTAPEGSNSQQLATTAFVKAAIDDYVLSAKFVDESFDIAMSSNEVTTVQAFTVSSPIDVWVNGVKKRQANDWSRDVATKRIIFTELIPVNAWVEVRIWL